MKNSYIEGFASLKNPICHFMLRYDCRALANLRRLVKKAERSLNQK